MAEPYEESLEPKWKAIIERTYNSIRSSSGVTADEETITQLLAGSFDTHVHAGPDSFGRRTYTEADVAIKACGYGMGGVVFKCQCSASSAREQFVRQIADRWAEDNGKKRIDIFSGVVLNYPVGGINPYAAEASLAMGGKYVWTPTRDASHHHRAAGSAEKGIDVCDANGRLVPQMYDIFKMIAEKDAILGISHQSTRERYLMVKEAKKSGVRRIVIEHPQLHVTRLTIEQMREFRDMGVYLGICYAAAVPNFINPEIDKFEVAEIIKALGTTRLISQTDMTQLQNPDPVEAMRLFAKVLLSLGVTEAEIREIFVHNCRELLY
jgi:hypothetical protein